MATKTPPTTQILFSVDAGSVGVFISPSYVMALSTAIQLYCQTIVRKCLDGSAYSWDPYQTKFPVAMVNCTEPVPLPDDDRVAAALADARKAITLAEDTVSQFGKQDTYECHLKEAKQAFDRPLSFKNA